MKQPVNSKEPDNTAVRTAMWRALHVQVDAKPSIIEDEIGLQLIAPPEGWQERLDMKYTKRLRAAIVARAPFIEDLVVEQTKNGIGQYVLLGAGLDTFAQRRPEIASHLQVYEIDQPHTLQWKKERLLELGFGIPDYLHFIPVNFENTSWLDALVKAGFNINKPAVITCTGVTIYLTKQAIESTLKHMATFARGSVLAITLYLPIALLDEEDKAMQEIGEKGARERGTPFVSFFTPDEINQLAEEAGFTTYRTVSTKDMIQNYFANRSDGLLPASGEMFLVAQV